MTVKEEKTQYKLIQEFLTNSDFHFNHLMIKGIIKFLYDKFGSEFWKYIIEDNSDLFKSFRQAEWEWAKQWYHLHKEEKKYQKELKRREEKAQQKREFYEEERKHRNAWGN